VVWLAASVLVGDVVLFVGLFLEHFIALRRRAASVRRTPKTTS
jgi:hypothetical protein